ncbi:unnamed protein product, partial [Staurois parvus]
MPGPSSMMSGPPMAPRMMPNMHPAAAPPQPQPPQAAMPPIPGGMMAARPPLAPNGMYPAPPPQPQAPPPNDGPTPLLWCLPPQRPHKRVSPESRAQPTSPSCHFVPGVRSFYTDGSAFLTSEMTAGPHFLEYLLENGANPCVLLRVCVFHSPPPTSASNTDSRFFLFSKCHVFCFVFFFFFFGF